MAVSRGSRRIPKPTARLLLSYIVTFTVLLRNTSRVSTDRNRSYLSDASAGAASLSSRPLSCSQNANFTLTQLIAKMNEDPNKNAMISLEIPIHSANNSRNNMTINIPGLNLNTFHHKRIAFLGDSTLFYMAKYLVSMLHHDGKKIGGYTYDKMTMRQADQFVFQNKQIPLKGTDLPPPFKRPDTWIQWWGMTGNSHGRTEEMMEQMFGDAEGMGPDVIVANMAFHWFHLCGYSEKHCPSYIDSPIISHWIHYKETWLQRVYDFAIKVNAKVLLFKTANYICGSARTGDFATGDALYQKMDTTTIEGCMERLKPLGKDLFLELSDIENYCKWGQLTEVGSRYLNDQMVDFVRNVQDSSSTSGLTVGIYNDHDIESCSTTTDAIHHKSAIVARIRLLADTINSYLKCTR